MTHKETENIYLLENLEMSIDIQENIYLLEHLEMSIDIQENIYLLENLEMSIDIQEKWIKSPSHVQLLLYVLFVINNLSFISFLFNNFLF